MRGRKPKPTHLKVIAGNPGKRPLNEQEPRYDPKLLKPPAFLSREAKAHWRCLAQLLYAQGILTEVDVGTLAVCCQAYGRWLQAEKALAALAKMDPDGFGLLVKYRGGAVKNPLVGMAHRAMEFYLRAAGEFGLTPSSRSRISALPMGAAQLSPEAKSWLKYSEPMSRWPE